LRVYQQTFPRGEPSQQGWIFKTTPQTLVQQMPAVQQAPDVNAWPAEILDVRQVGLLQPGWMQNPRLVWPVAFQPGIRSGELTGAGQVLDVRQVDRGQFGWVNNPGISWPAALQPGIRHGELTSAAATLDVTAVDRPQFGWINNPTLTWPVNLTPLPKSQNVRMESYVLDVRYVRRMHIDFVGSPSITWPSYLNPAIRQGAETTRSAPVLNPSDGFQIGFWNNYRITVVTTAQIVPATIQSRSDLPPVSLAIDVTQVDRGQFGWARNPSLTWPAALQAGIRSGAETTLAQPMLNPQAIDIQQSGWIFTNVPIPPSGLFQFHHHYGS
jgi:hypothetical protein